MAYDIGIIGSGPAGYTGALRAAQAGKKVALVECDRVGGACLNRGCIPTKALRQAAEVWAAVKDAGRFGIEIPEGASINWMGMRKHSDAVVEQMRTGIKTLLKAGGVTLMKGEATVLSPGRLQVKKDDALKELSVRDIVIATGARPSSLPGLTIDEKQVLSSSGFLELMEFPRDTVIVGAGVIGCELADILATLGGQVTVVETAPRILLTEDHSVARLMQKTLAGRGVKFILNSSISDLADSKGRLRMVLTDGTNRETDKIVVSVGRRPYYEGLNLEALGVEFNHGAVKVDTQGRTGAAGLWAVGDVIGGLMLAHAAAHEMEIVLENILGAERNFEPEIIPSVIYTRPEVASVGLREDAARDAGRPVKIGRFAYAAAGMAQCLGETEGYVKVITEPEIGRILGATIIGAQAAELIHELAIAVRQKMTVQDFLGVVHAHPTLAEIVFEAVADAEGQAVHKATRR